MRILLFLSIFFVVSLEGPPAKGSVRGEIEKEIFESESVLPSRKKNRHRR